MNYFYIIIKAYSSKIFVLFLLKFENKNHIYIILQIVFFEIKKVINNTIIYQE
jgi:hypothetical protein